jgi:hypothetical protein
VSHEGLVFIIGFGKSNRTAPASRAMFCTGGYTGIRIPLRIGGGPAAQYGSHEPPKDYKSKRRN